MSPELNRLIEAIIADDIITDKERAVLHAKAAQEGISADEIDVLVEGMLDQKIAEGKKQAAAANARERLDVKPPKNREQIFGVVHKCPSCGSPIESGKGQCGSCGYEFRGIEANSSVKELSKLILKAEEDDRTGDNIIINFPVPNTKEDLLEFIFFTKSKAFSRDELSDAYRKKYYECIDKASFYFPNDPQLKMVIEEGKRNKRNFYKNLSSGGRYALNVICVIIGVLLLLCILHLLTVLVGGIR